MINTYQARILDHKIIHVKLDDIAVDPTYNIKNYQDKPKIVDMIAKGVEHLPPIQLVKLHSRERTIYEVTDQTKGWYIHNGYHRYAAHTLCDRDSIQAIIVKPILNKNNHGGR